MSPLLTSGAHLLAYMREIIRQKSLNLAFILWIFRDISDTLLQFLYVAWKSYSSVYVQLNIFSSYGESEKSKSSGSLRRSVFKKLNLGKDAKSFNLIGGVLSMFINRD
jgi:hypothetical protein